MAESTAASRLLHPRPILACLRASGSQRVCLRQFQIRSLRPRLPPHHVDALAVLRQRKSLRARAAKPVMLQPAPIAILSITAVVYAKHEHAAIAQVVQRLPALGIKTLIQHLNSHPLGFGRRSPSGNTGGKLLPKAFPHLREDFWNYIFQMAQNPKQVPRVFKFLSFFHPESAP